MLTAKTQNKVKHGFTIQELHCIISGYVKKVLTKHFRINTREVPDLFMRKLLKKGIILVLILVISGLPSLSIEIYAAIKDATVFQDVAWDYMGESPVISESGWLQSMCSTPDYIICLENSSSKTSDPDTLLAFYRNDVDENGNPVQKYSLAKKITETDYEHGNGMTYNPHTHEILIVGSTPLKEENRGLAYIVDADTLKLKRTVRLSSTYNLLGIAYVEDTNQYVVQFFNVGYTTSFFLRIDADTFQQVGDIIPARMWQDIRHQDFCVSGDYLISLAFTNNVTNSNVMHIYSLETGEFLAGYDLNINGSGEFIEPESICELSPGEILIGNALKNPRRISFYSTTVAAAFKLTTNVENGEISGSQKTVDYGSDYTVSYEPKENFELESIIVDGQLVDLAKYATGYVFENVSQNHSIDVKFKEKPKFNITTNVENGFIDAAMVRHRDNDVTVSYAPNEHYEIDEILVDDQPIDVAEAANGYTFTNIQQDHHLTVKFKEIPSYKVTTEVSHGTITPNNDKVYRDDSHTVYYEPEQDYKIAWVEVDGVKTYVHQIHDQWNQYTFEDVQGDHTIKVVYYWKYLPWIILFSGLSALTIIVSIIIFDKKRRIRREKKRRYKRRKKIKKQIEENRKKAESAIKKEEKDQVDKCDQCDKIEDKLEKDEDKEY